MNENIIVISTAVIAMATVIYSIFNYLLWRETKKQRVISKVTAVINLLIIMDKLKKEAQDDKEKIVMESIYEVLYRQIIIDFIYEMGSESFIEFGRKIDEKLKDKGIAIPEINKYWINLVNEAKKMSI